MEAGSTTAVAPASVWVTYGEQEVHRCPPGKPLSLPQGFLLANPPGPYTCLRTVGHRSTAMLQFHLDRLWESAKATGLGSAATEEGRQSLERRTTETIARTIKLFWEENENVTEGCCPECMATVLYLSGGSNGDIGKGSGYDSRIEGNSNPSGGRPIKILAHAWPLPTGSSLGGQAGVQVLVSGSGRKQPGSKHSSWLRERQRLEELKFQAGAQEVVLSRPEYSPNGPAQRLLLEGLISNFFVVEDDGTVCTAPSGVLMGGMRQLVISVCEQEGIAFRHEAPDLARAGYWREAFLTGTGRILTPVVALLVQGDADDTSGALMSSKSGGNVELRLSRLEIPCFRAHHTEPSPECPRPSVIQQLRSRICAELAASATRLF